MILEIGKQWSKYVMYIPLKEAKMQQGCRLYIRHSTSTVRAGAAGVCMSTSWGAAWGRKFAQDQTIFCRPGSTERCGLGDPPSWHLPVLSAKPVPHQRDRVQLPRWVESFPPDLPALGQLFPAEAWTTGLEMFWESSIVLCDKVHKVRMVYGIAKSASSFTWHLLTVAKQPTDAEQVSRCCGTPQRGAPLGARLVLLCTCLNQELHHLQVSSFCSNTKGRWNLVVYRPGHKRTLQNKNRCCSQFWHVLACFGKGKRGAALKATKCVETYLRDFRKNAGSIFHIELLQIGISFNQGLDRSMSTHQCGLKQGSPLSAIDVVHICTFFEKVV